MLCELVLQMHTEVHVLHRVDHNVDELHACHLEQRSRKVDRWTNASVFQRIKESEVLIYSVYFQCV